MGEPETKFDGQGRAYIDPADLLKSPTVRQQYAAAKRVAGQQADAVTRRADLPRRLADAEAERDRLRAALDKIAKRRPSSSDEVAAFYRCRQDARDALNGDSNG